MPILEKHDKCGCPTSKAWESGVDANAYSINTRSSINLVYLCNAVGSVMCWVCVQSMRAADIRPDHISYSTLIAGTPATTLLHASSRLVRSACNQQTCPISIVALFFHR